MHFALIPLYILNTLVTGVAGFIGSVFPFVVKVTCVAKKRKIFLNTCIA